MNESYKCDFLGEISNDEIWYSSIFLTRDLFFFNLEKSECLLSKEKQSSEKCDHNLLLSWYGS